MNGVCRNNMTFHRNVPLYLHFLSNISKRFSFPRIRPSELIFYSMGGSRISQRGAGANTEGAGNLLFRQLSRKLHENEENWNEGWGCLKIYYVDISLHSISLCENIWNVTTSKEQESIKVECVLPACQPYLLWWLPQGVSTGGRYLGG